MRTVATTEVTVARTAAIDATSAAGHTVTDRGAGRTFGVCRRSLTALLIGGSAIALWLGVDVLRRGVGYLDESAVAPAVGGR